MRFWKENVEVRKDGLIRDSKMVCMNWLIKWKLYVIYNSESSRVYNCTDVNTHSHTCNHVSYMQYHTSFICVTLHYIYILIAYSVTIGAYHIQIMNNWNTLFVSPRECVGVPRAKVPCWVASHSHPGQKCPPSLLTGMGVPGQAPPCCMGLRHTLLTHLSSWYVLPLCLWLFFPPSVFVPQSLSFCV